MPRRAVEPADRAVGQQVVELRFVVPVVVHRRDIVLAVPVEIPGHHPAGHLVGIIISRRCARVPRLPVATFHFGPCAVGQEHMHLAGASAVIVQRRDVVLPVGVKVPGHHTPLRFRRILLFNYTQFHSVRQDQ